MRKTGAPRLPTLIMSDTGKMARVKIMFAYGFADIPGATGNHSYIFCQSLHSNIFPLTKLKIDARSRKNHPPIQDRIRVSGSAAGRDSRSAVSIPGFRLEEPPDLSYNQAAGGNSLHFNRASPNFTGIPSTPLQLNADLFSD
jgi:hypothetical protein